MMPESVGYSASITLCEAIAQLRLAEAENDATESMSLEAESAFEQHDAVHVLFGCGTSIQDEIAAHVWMLLATTANVGEMHRAVASQSHRQVLTDIGHFKLVRVWLRSLPRILSIVLKTWQMKKKIAVEDLAQLKAQPVLDIRREHGIVL